MAKENGWGNQRDRSGRRGKRAGSLPEPGRLPAQHIQYEENAFGYNLSIPNQSPNPASAGGANVDRDVRQEMPKLRPPADSSDQGIVRDEKGQEQPRDKVRAPESRPDGAIETEVGRPGRSRERNCLSRSPGVPVAAMNLRPSHQAA